MRFSPLVSSATGKACSPSRDRAIARKTRLTRGECLCGDLAAVPGAWADLVLGELMQRRDDPRLIFTCFGIDHDSGPPPSTAARFGLDFGEIPSLDEPEGASATIRCASQKCDLGQCRLTGKGRSRKTQSRKFDRDCESVSAMRSFGRRKLLRAVDSRGVGFRAPDPSLSLRASRVGWGGGVPIGAPKPANEVRSAKCRVRSRRLEREAAIETHESGLNEKERETTKIKRSVDRRSQTETDMHPPGQFERSTGWCERSDVAAAGASVLRKDRGNSLQNRFREVELDGGQRVLV